MNNIDIIISDLTPQLINIFTVPNVKEIILYGSVARGTATSESDIDIAVILDDYTDKMHDEMIEFVVDLELKYNKVISVLPIYNKQFNEWGNITPFFKNIKNIIKSFLCYLTMIKQIISIYTTIQNTTIIHNIIIMVIHRQGMI